MHLTFNQKGSVKSFIDSNLGSSPRHLMGKGLVNKSYDFRYSWIFAIHM